MKAYTIKYEICCENCKEVFEADHGKKANELDTVGVAEWIAEAEMDCAKCNYCGVDLEHDSEELIRLIEASNDRRDSDIADKRAWHNGRFGR
jgi:hypothetical protein